MTETVETESTPRVGARARWIERPLFVAAALLATLGSFAALTLFLGRGLIFWRDEWYFIMYRVGHSPDTLLSAHGGHLSLAPIVIYKFLFKVAGLDPSHYWVYRSAAVAFLVVDGLLLWEIGRRRVGPAAAILPVAVVLFLGPGWMDLIWPFQIVFSGAIAAGLGMLLALERQDRRGDIAACVLLAISLSFSGVGLAFAAGAIVDVLLRRNRMRRAWILAVPLLLWLAWYSEYGRRQSSVTWKNVTLAPAYVFDAAGAVAGAMTTVELSWGRVLAVLVGVAVTVRLFRGGWREPRLWSTLAILFAFWASLALARASELGGEATASRYLYPGAVFLSLVILEVARGHRPNELQFALLVVALGFVLATNVPRLVEGARDPRGKSALAKPGLGAVELARDVVDPHFTIESYSGGGAPIAAAWYLASADRWGSPADTPAEIARRPEGTREVVDAVLVAAMRVKAAETRTVTPEGPRPHVATSGGGSVTRAASCVRLAADGAPASFDLTLASPALAVTSEGGSARLSLRRFADRFTVPLESARAGSTVRLAFPPDAASEPWRLRITTSGSVTSCSVR